MNLDELKSGLLSKKFRQAFVSTALVLSPLTLAAQQAETWGQPAATPNAAVIIAPPPENEPVAQAHRFTPLQSFGQLFSTDDEKERNIFYTQSRDAIAEFRVLSNSTETGPLTRAERQRAAMRGPTTSPCKSRPRCTSSHGRRTPISRRW